jgi:hypothetical protein
VTGAGVASYATGGVDTGSTSYTIGAAGNSCTVGIGYSCATGADSTL